MTKRAGWGDRIEWFLAIPLVSALRKRIAGHVAWPTGGAPYLRALFARLRAIGVLSSVTRFQLLLGDEGVTLVQLRGHEVQDALFIGPDAENGLATLRDSLATDPRADVLVLVDVLEQMYRDEQLPRVGRFDRGSVLQRRLSNAFPQDRLKTAIPLPKIKGSPDSALFASLPETEAIGHWIQFLEALPNPIIGFCLLPIESLSMVERLAPSTQGEERRVWRALVSLQAASGFRQVFESDGKLIVTRLTPRPPGDMTDDNVAQLIERELRSSITYVKRMGYRDGDRLDLIVLADPAACRTIAERDLPVSSVTVYTPHQAGLLLGIGAVAPEASSYADVLHTQWFGHKIRPAAILPTATLRDRQLLGRRYKIGFVLATAMSLFALLFAVDLMVSALDVTTTRQLLSRQLETERQGLEVAKAKVNSFTIPLEDLQLVDHADGTIQTYGTSPVALLKTVGDVLEPGTLVQKASFTVPDLAAKDSAASNGAAPPIATAARPNLHPGKPGTSQPVFDLHLVVRFLVDPSMEADAPLQRAKSLHDRLARAFPSYDVTTVELPTNALHLQVLEGSAAKTAGPANGAPVLAEYLIRRKS